MLEITYQLPLALVFVFVVFLYQILLQNPTIFLKRHGRKHALTGLAYLGWISYGFFDLFLTKSSESEVDSMENQPFSSFYFIFDVILGVLGVILTLLAAYEFQHKNVKNIASGVLDEHATVTYGEMIEHSFYQILNLFQAIYLHCMIFLLSRYQQNKAAYLSSSVPSFSSFSVSSLSFYHIAHIVLLIFVTCLWNIRHLYPVNKFSDNYNKIDEKSTNFIRFLYRIKKYQYVFYKRFLLHGLNLTVALNYHQIVFGNNGSSILGAEGRPTEDAVGPVTRGEESSSPESLIYFVNTKYFHIYWLCLNFSYVMEFFLQTLVKKGYMKQEMMLNLQKILMFASTIVAINLLQYISFPVAIISLVLNFTYRKHDFLNSMIIFVGFAFF
jgi:hypothetical protein